MSELSVPPETGTATYAYSWTDDATARVLRSQTEIHEARDEGELEEFPGVPDTNGTVFTVNCPVPVLAPATFEASTARPQRRRNT